MPLRAGARTLALRELLTATVDARPLAVVRIVVGLAALGRALEADRMLARLAVPVVIRLPYVSWLPQLPAWAFPGLLGLWALSALLFALGCWTRTAAATLAATVLYVVLLDEQTYSNHLYMLVLVVALLGFANAGAAGGVDAYRRASASRRRGGDAQAPGRAGAWAVFLLRSQVTATYLFAGLAKINATFVSGATMSAYISHNILAAVPEPVRVPFVLACSWGSIALELWLAVALWRRRWRVPALVAGVAFHAGMVALLPRVRFQLLIFAAEMLALYTLFFASALEPSGRSRHASAS